jgi:microcompartment protein CcmK/EutM
MLVVVGGRGKQGRRPRGKYFYVDNVGDGLDDLVRVGLGRPARCAVQLKKRIFDQSMGATHGPTPAAGFG